MLHWSGKKVSSLPNKRVGELRLDRNTERTFYRPPSFLWRLKFGHGIPRNTEGEITVTLLLLGSDPTQTNLTPTFRVTGLTPVRSGQTRVEIYAHIGGWVSNDVWNWMTFPMNIDLPSGPPVFPWGNFINIELFELVKQGYMDFWRIRTNRSLSYYVPFPIYSLPPMEMFYSGPDNVCSSPPQSPDNLRKSYKFYERDRYKGSGKMIRPYDRDSKLRLTIPILDTSLRHLFSHGH